MFFRLHEPASMSGSTLTWANKSTAANPAIASRFKGGCQWRGVAEPGRSANMNLLALIAVLLAGIPALSASAQFPSADSSKSPHRKWQVTCKSSEDNSGHLLVLTRIGGASVELRLFGRHCSTLWSEDGSHLAVTDWLGSNMSDVFIYSVTNAATGKSLADLLPKGAIPREQLGGHCYFEATNWIDPRHLRVRVFGHTEQARGRSFEHVYVFDLRSGNFEQLGKRSPNKNGVANGSQPVRRETNSTPLAAGSRR
jgi:hypothetical protein